MLTVLVAASALLVPAPRPFDALKRSRTVVCAAEGQPPRAMGAGAGLSLGYGVAAGGLLARATLMAPSHTIMERAVLGATALAVACDFGPSAVRDLPVSNAATDAAVSDLIEASPPVILVDGDAKNLGGVVDAEAQAAASGRLEDSHRWALLVRCRLLGDLMGVLLMSRGWACVGAATMLAVHAMIWAQGAAAIAPTPRACAAKRRCPRTAGFDSGGSDALWQVPPQPASTAPPVRRLCRRRLRASSKRWQLVSPPPHSWAPSAALRCSARSAAGRMPAR
jgi:hypothetical protein